MRGLRTIVLIGITALATLGVRAAFGTPISGGVVGKSATQVKTSFSNISVNARTDDPWVAVKSMPVSVPRGTKAIIVVRANGEDTCLSGSVGFCQARIKIAGKVMEHESQVDRVVGGASSTEVWSLERASGVLGPGKYKVVLQIHATGDNTQHSLAFWHLTVERIRV